MGTMGTITMSDKQQRRAEILARLRDGKVGTKQAAGLLGVMDRQVRRQLARYLCEGMASVVHGNAGRAPANKTALGVRHKLAELAGSEGVYHDFNTCHLQEWLL